MKRRSPKFPFIRLEKALSYLPKLRALEKSRRLNRTTAIEAMGYSSFNGAAARNFAALFAYDLVGRSDDGLALTDTGRALLDTKDKDAAEKDKLPRLQRAALEQGQGGF